MRNFLRPIFVATFAALLATSASTPSGAAHQSTTAYDGLWSVMIYTLYGDCSRSLRYSLRIVGGRVQSEEQNYQLAGGVKPSGEINVTVAEAGRSANGVGRLSGNQGRGQWRTTTGECAGQWTAERRNSSY